MKLLKQIWRIPVRFASLALVLLAASAHAEQMQRIGGYEVHYIVVPTTFLKADIAARYGLTRGRNRALVNVSVIEPGRGGVQASVRGETKNLLGQVQTLEFEEVREGEAVYYLALLNYADEETHRLTLDVAVPDGTTGRIEHMQKLYWDR